MSQKTLMDPLPKNLTLVPKERWPVYRGKNPPQRVWVSKRYMVQEFKEVNGYIRLSVNMVKRKAGGKWRDGLSWDQLQLIKSECGYGDAVALEVYPENGRIVNNANMRHLWITPTRPAFVW